jgi:hypothetical protein
MNKESLRQILVEEGMVKSAGNVRSAEVWYGEGDEGMFGVKFTEAFSARLALTFDAVAKASEDFFKDTGHAKGAMVHEVSDPARGMSVVNNPGERAGRMRLQCLQGKVALVRVLTIQTETVVHGRTLDGDEDPKNTILLIKKMLSKKGWKA